jgi:hypothetical protein
MRNRLAAVALALAALATGCTQEQLQDVETRWEFAGADDDLTAVVTNPDSITVLRNIDLHPNLAIVCYEGAAFITHTREAAPFPDPRLDHTCPGGEEAR